MCQAINDLVEDGRKLGLQQGILQTLYGLVKDGLLSVADAAARVDMEECAFAEEMKEAGFCDILK